MLDPLFTRFREHLLTIQHKILAIQQKRVLDREPGFYLQSTDNPLAIQRYHSRARLAIQRYHSRSWIPVDCSGLQLGLQAREQAREQDRVSGLQAHSRVNTREKRVHFFMDYSWIALWIANGNSLTYGSLFKYCSNTGSAMLQELFRNCLEGIQVQLADCSGKILNFFIDGTVI